MFSRGPRIRYLKLLVGLTVLCAVPLQSCRREAPPAQPNIVLITIDALRADHLSCYGYERKTTPFIDSLAAKGCLFENCYASSSWTAPSMASLFTSLYSRSHGVKHGVAEGKVIQGQELLAESFTTLAESLKAAGYKTFGLSSNAHMSEKTGMAQGFDEFTSYWFCNAPIIHKKLEQVKEQLAASQPFFLWIHYFDPHSEYRARSPWINEYSSDPEAVEELRDKDMPWLRKNIRKIRRSPESQKALVDLYDSEIGFTDDYVRRLFEEILPKGDMLTVVTADHGEAFLEHDQLGHAQTLFCEEVKIPLIIVSHKRDIGRRIVSEPVSLLDVYPTLLGCLGLPIPPQCQGEDLADLVKGGVPAPDRRIICEFDRGESLTSMLADNWRLIVNNENDRKRTLHYLPEDPGEMEDRERRNPDKADRLQIAIDEWREDTLSFQAPQGPLSLSPQQEKRLRSLGYLR